MEIYKKLPQKNYNRLIVCLLFSLVCSAISTLSAQEKKLAMGNNSLSVEQIFKKIEEQSGVVFTYSKSDFQKFGKIQLGSPNGTLNEILSQALKDTGFSYQLAGAHIIIGKASAPRMEKLKIEKATLMGKVVCSQTYKPISSATVELTANNKIRSLTDVNGNFELKNVPIGDHTIRITHNDYMKTRVRTFVRTGKNTMRQITVDRNELRDTLHAGNAEVKALPLATAIIKDTIIQARKETLYLGSSPGLIDAEGEGLRPRYAFKTNGLYLATSTPNISFEVALAKKWTTEVTLGYNPWNFSPGKIQHGLVMAEARYWTCKSFEGHFFGMHGVYSEFNVGELPFIPSIENYTYNGNLYGGGISYGYHFPLKGRWGLELTAGAGYIHLNYDKYQCIGCRELVGSYTSDYWGPTKAGVSLIYMID